MRNLTIVLSSLLVLTLIFACSSEKQSETQPAEKQTMTSHQGHAMQDSMSIEMVTDPVCGMQIKKEDAVATTEYNDKTYYFCMEEDKKAFDENPGKYVNKAVE